MARLLMVARDRFHVYRHHQDTAESECVPVLMAALGQITGTVSEADIDHAEMIAIVPSTLWSLTVDPNQPGSLVQSVEGLGLAARAVRDQLSNDTWMVLAGVERAVVPKPGPAGLARGGRQPARGRAFPVVGRDAHAVRGGRRVDGAGRRLDDDGHRQTYRTRAVADRVAAGHADHRPQHRPPSKPSSSRHWWRANRRSSTGAARWARSVSPRWPS